MRKVRHVTCILQHAGLPLLNTLGQEHVPVYVYFVLGQCGLGHVTPKTSFLGFVFSQDRGRGF